MKKRVEFLIVILGFIFLNSVSALQEGYCVNSVVNDISPTSIGINEDFSVGILIDNCGEEISKDVVFELVDISPYLTVKEPLKKDIGIMGYANSNRFLVYHMKTADDIKPGTYYIKYTLKYYAEDLEIKNEGNFSIEVIGDLAKLNIASAKTKPVLPKKGETIELTVRVENFGDGKANSIKIKALHPFQGVKDSFIGTLGGNEDSSAVFTFIADKAGEFVVPLEIEYTDDFGKHKLEEKMSLVVLDKKSDKTDLIIIIILILFFGVLIFYLIRSNRAKNKVIHQLLGNNSGEDKHKKYQK